MASGVPSTDTEVDLRLIDSWCSTSDGLPAVTTTTTTTSSGSSSSSSRSSCVSHQRLVKPCLTGHTSHGGSSHDNDARDHHHHASTAAAPNHISTISNQVECEATGAPAEQLFPYPFPPAATMYASCKPLFYRPHGHARSRPSPAVSAPPAMPWAGCDVHVGKLPRRSQRSDTGVTEALLRALQAHGPVRRLTVKGARGFAFARFATPQGATAAMEAAQAGSLAVLGRPVTLARPRSTPRAVLRELCAATHRGVPFYEVVLPARLRSRPAPQRTGRSDASTQRKLAHHATTTTATTTTSASAMAAAASTITTGATSLSSCGFTAASAITSGDDDDGDDGGASCDRLDDSSGAALSRSASRGAGTIDSANDSNASGGMSDPVLAPSATTSSTLRAASMGATSVASHASTTKARGRATKGKPGVGAPFGFLVAVHVRDSAGKLRRFQSGSTAPTLPAAKDSAADVALKAVASDMLASLAAHN